MVSLFIFLVTLETTFGCKSTYYWEPIYNTTIAEWPLDICLEEQLYGMKWSHRLTCDSNDALENNFWNNSNCTNNPVLVYTQSHYSFVTDVKCDGNECDYVIIRHYDATDSCESGNGDFTSSAYVVNLCEQTKLLVWNDNDNKYWYTSMTCNDSMVVQHLHLNSDCSDPPDPTSSSVLMVDGNCYQYHDQDLGMYHTNIYYCSKPNGNNYKAEQILIFHNIFSIIMGFISICVQLWIVIKLFSNLYIFHVIYYYIDSFAIRIPICCKIKFSDKHNWIVLPSKLNRIYAILSPISVILAIISALILVMSELVNTSYWITSDILYLVVFAYFIFGNIAQLFAVFYMTSTLEYYMKSETLIKLMIPSKFIMFIKFIATLHALSAIVAIPMVYIYKLSQYQMGVIIVTFLMGIFINLSLFYLYYRGLNNVCHYWYSKHWVEYEKYGETERTHEIIINISRAAVSVIVFVAFGILTYSIGFIDVYTFNNQTFDYKSETMREILSLSGHIISDLGSLFFSLSIYFIYPFGHVDYERICVKCHHQMYEYFKKRHQNQVANGIFDGLQYQPYRQKCSCCFKQINQNNMRAKINDANDSDDDL